MSAVVIDFNDVMPAKSRPERYDLDLIVRRLRETAEHWVPWLFPRGRRSGDEWRLANIHGDPPRNTGSCVIALRGPHAGDWIDFDGNQGGGPLSVIEAATGLSGTELVARAAEIAGVAPGAPARKTPAAQTVTRRDYSEEIQHILSRAVPAAGTPVEVYLAGRGLRLPEGADLLFHPDLTHWETKTGWPAMIGCVRDHAGEIVGLHRTWLDPASDGSVCKSPVAKPKKALGPVGGGAVRLASLKDGDRLALTEGIETGLAVIAACPELPVWAALSTSGLEQIHLPAAATRIVICADNDVSGAGIRSAETAARRLCAEGRDVVIATPPGEGQDFNDLLLCEGPKSVARLVAQACAAGRDEATLQVGQHRPLNYSGAGDSPAVMRADEGDLARAVERAWSLIMSSNRTPWVYRFASQMTWVVPDDEGRPVATPVNEERLRHMLARLATWRRLNARGDLVPTSPPSLVIKSLLATPDPALPVLVGIVATPVFGRNGALLTTPGYHPDARLLYVPAPGFVVPDIPPRPTADEIAAARRLICEDLLGDFPFTGPAERAHAVALLLLGFLRGVIEGPTPLHLIEKPAPGSGATLMVDAIATILTGTGASVMTEGRDDEEWRKRVTAKLRQIPAIVLIDNLRETLDSAALAAALTAPFWEDRILGASEMARLPIRCLWIATGNNPNVSNEMARRLVRIRLDARVERPWQRTGFQHPDLMAWVRSNRARLVGACLTLCQAWIAAGRPRGTRAIGSYENWAQLIGGVLEVAEIEGFLGNLDEMMEAADKEGAIWRSFVAAWWDRFGTAEVGTVDLYEVAIGCEPPLQLGTGSEHSQRTRLGKALIRIRDRVFDCEGRMMRVLMLGVSHKAKQWQLTLEEAGGKPLFREGEGERLGTEGNVESQRSPVQPSETIGFGERGERGERFPMLTRTRTHAPANSSPEKPSPPSPRSPSSDNSVTYAGEPAGEGRDDVSDVPPLPDWLREVM